MPADAATESWNASDPARRGSIRTSAATARASSRTADTGQPSVVVPAAITAIAVARRTDGSNRVISAKKPSRARVAASRLHSPSRRSAGAATARTNATLAPDTARRWLSPEARKS